MPAMPSGPIYDEPAPAPYHPIPSNTTPAPSWPAKRSAQPAMETQPPAASAPAVDVEFHRPTNKDTGWITADYLVSVSRSLRPKTPLVTTSLPNAARAGALGQAGTAAIYGSESIDFGMISGVRLNVGCFLGSDNRYSVEFDGFWRGSSTPSFYAASDARGNPVIARPIFNIADGANREAAFLTSFPALFEGSTQIQTRSQLAGFELNGRYHLYWWERLHADALLGFRYLNLTERTQFNDRLRPLVDKQLTFRGAIVNPPNSISDEDIFSTNNQFFGGQIGARASWETGRFSLDGFAKLAFGVSQQQVTIDGSTTLITPTGTQTVQGGILAQKSNIGTYNRSAFTVVPELGFNLGVAVTEQVHVRLGYSILLWDRVARPTSQIDHNVNTGQVPSSPNFGLTTGPNAPVFQSHDEFFWNHFFNVGMELRY